MDTNSSLGFTLHHLSFMLDRQSDLFLQERYGIGFSQFKILMSLMRHTNVQQRDIAEYLGQTESSVSRQIQSLIESGLVSSRRDANDRRQRVTQLTIRGEKLARVAMAGLEKHYAPMFDTLSDKKQIELAELLDTMRDYVANNVKYGFWTRARHKDD